MFPPAVLNKSNHFFVYPPDVFQSNKVHFPVKFQPSTDSNPIKYGKFLHRHGHQRTPGPTVLWRALMETEKAKIRCQRIGCEAFFTEDDNPDDSCQYHSGPPIFHDGGKEWGCCKQRSHDFSLFLAIPGCKRGKHTSEKPQTKAAPSPNKPVTLSTTGNAALDAAKAACARCRQGFFCSDHGSQVGVLNSVSYRSVPSESAAKPKSTFVPKLERIIDLNQKQVCGNKGCGKNFTERDNHETACLYHPGPAVFHDRLRGWQCCDVHVKEFDEFLTIPPCTKGWHNANPDS